MTNAMDPRLHVLAAILDAQRGRYEQLGHASAFDGYLAVKIGHADEETLTEPVLAEILNRVLGFPVDEYVPQLGKAGLKPDFTPRDLIAHSFVLDAKSSDQDLAVHEPQIRRYMGQRALDRGVLFNLRELRVYRRLEKGYEADFSFTVLPLWRLAHAEAMPGPEYEAFLRFCDLFRYREMDAGAKIEHVRQLAPWSTRLGSEPVEVDVEFLVDQLRVLSRELSEDAAAQATELEKWLALNPARRSKLRDELRLLALDLAPGSDLDLPEDPLSWRDTSGVAQRAWRQYLLRVSYLALTRILLYRAWEDVQFVESYLYDGGFDQAYVQLSQDVERVLDEAFRHGADQYRELFSADSNYAWYRPREPALVNVLYLLAPVPLGELDADVLGELYVSYVDEIDRDRLGQFFTPRPVVRFMLDRIGFKGNDVFRVEGDKRVPLRVLDFAGSGGFLVEAARRIIDEGGLGDDVHSLYEGLAAITTGFVGGEISPFPYYLTEINLLLQVSRLLGRLRQHGERPPLYTLGVLHIDTLATKSQTAESLDVDPKLRLDHAELADRGFDLAQLDEEKRERFRELRKDGGFDLVVGNPPYVAEANNKPLFDRLKSIGAWRGIYRGKTDYSYYFLYLAVEKLAPGGRLAVIVPAGWMNAGAADFLREKLSSELRLDELFLFGAYRLFAAVQGPAPTPTVESAILVATKAPVREGHAVRVVALEDETPWPDREALLVEMRKRANATPARKEGILVHDVLQAELRADYPWPVKFGAEDVPARAVAHLQRALDDETKPVEPLESQWKVFRGIETGADAYTSRIDKRLTSPQRSALAASGLKIGDPIMELPAESEHNEPWKSHAGVLARSPESRAILYASVDPGDYALILRLAGNESPPSAVLAALEPWKPLLSSRAEIARNARRQWWETAWARSATDLAKPKVFALYRTDRARFALDESGEWKPSNKATLVVGTEQDAPVAYLCGLLNSELLDLWYAVRGKTPWHVRRNYEPKRMNEIPYRRPEGDRRADEVAELVRQIAANRKALLPHRPVIRDLTRTVKDPWKDGPVVADDAALVANLPDGATVSVRIDPALHVTGEPAGKATRTSSGVLAFRRGGKETGRVEGEAFCLDLLEVLLAGKATDDATKIVLPKDLADYARVKDALERDVRDLLAEGRELVERVERLVCALYEVPDDLTERVVEHAVARAQSSQPADD